MGIAQWKAKEERRLNGGGGPAQPRGSMLAKKARAPRPVALEATPDSVRIAEEQTDRERRAALDLSVPMRTWDADVIRARAAALRG